MGQRILASFLRLHPPSASFTLALKISESNLVRIKTQFQSFSSPNPNKNLKNRRNHLLSSLHSSPTEKMEAEETPTNPQSQIPQMKLLFVEMGVGYDQHGQDITVAAMRACKDAISSNSIPAFRGGSIPGVTTDHMKLKIKLGVPRLTQQSLDIDRVKSVFPYGEIVSFEVVDGGMICSSGVCLEAMGDKNDDCYIVNAAVYVGY